MIEGRNCVVRLFTTKPHMCRTEPDTYGTQRLLNDCTDQTLQEAVDDAYIDQFS